MLLLLLFVKHLFNITLIPLNILFCEIINEMSWDVKFGLQNREIGGGEGRKIGGRTCQTPYFWDFGMKNSSLKPRNRGGEIGGSSNFYSKNTGLIGNTSLMQAMIALYYATKRSNMLPFTP